MNPKTLLNWPLFALCLLGHGVAQAQPATPGAAAGNMVTEFKGKLKDFQRGVLLVSRDDGAEVMIQLPDDLSSFNFVAQAKPGFLQRGTMVRFAGTFGPNGTPLSPIEKVEVFQPIGPAQKLNGRQRERYVPGVYGQRGVEKAQAAAKYNIVGNLMGLNQSGVMMVQAGKTPLQVQLAATATFEIRFNNLSLAQAGDVVSVAGFYQPPDDTKVKADRVTITTDRVYGEPTQQKPRRRTRRSRDSDQDDDDKDDDDKDGGDKKKDDDEDDKDESDDDKG
ncbi:MAG: hypothetical protein MI861_14665 [Pirellulales bacterium]|nr:hypothetical protein [Pirellulales bacterium]